MIDDLDEIINLYDIFCSNTFSWKIAMVRFSTVQTFIHLLMCIFFVTKSSAESYKDNEGFNSYDDFLSENSFYESDGDGRYIQELFSRSYEKEEVNTEEESNSYDEIRPYKETFESDEHDRSIQDLPSKLYRDEETDAIRGFRRNGNLNL